MSKLDTLFQGIMSNEDMSAEFGYTPSDYLSIEHGSNSRNKYVKAIANMLLQYDKIVEEVKMDMRIKNTTGKIVIKENVLESIYRKLVKDLE